MPSPTFFSITEQVAEHVRAGILRGRWSGTLPGKHQFAAELGINHKTVEAALRMIEQSGLLATQCAGRGCRIMLPGVRAGRRPMRVAILIHEHSDRSLNSVVELRHELDEAGHTAIIPPRSMTELHFDVKRIARLVAQTTADAWVVVAGSREVLAWFAAQPVPAFAFLGHRRDVPMAVAGPDMVPAMRAATQALLDFGHRQIVLLTRQIHRLPRPSPVPGAFLAHLQAAGIRTSAYNLPHWEETAEGFQKLLGELLRVTPPTAMIIDEPVLFTAAQQFLARRRLRVPEDLSVICVDFDPTFAWCVPSIAHLRWVSKVSRGRKDLRQQFEPARFVNGGSIGRVPARPFRARANE